MTPTNTGDEPGASTPRNVSPDPDDDGVWSHPDFTESALSPTEHRVYEAIKHRYEDDSIPTTYRLQWIDGRDVLFARCDALPVPENEQCGAAVELDHNPEDNTWYITLYHEDGDPRMGFLKGFGASCTAETLTEALTAACEAMQQDDQLTTASL